MSRSARTLHPVSGVIIARNEEARIGLAIDSLRPLCREVLVVDSESTDRTRELALEHGARVVVRAFTTFEEQKNFAARTAEHDWVLFLDADEALTDSEEDPLGGIDWSRHGIVYRFQRRTHHLGAWIDRTRWGHEAVARLFHRGRARFVGGSVHEHVVGDTGAETVLPVVIRHWPYRNLEHHLEKINLYTSLAAGSGSPSAGKLVLSPLWKFLCMYVFEGGFRMGTRGFILSALAAYYVFVKYAKRWEREMKPSPGSE